MGLANWLTVLRIVLVPVFVSLLVYGRPGWALAVFLAAAVTDLLDGHIARRRKVASRLGALLDPLADKLLVAASFVTLTVLGAVPFWITAVVVSRDLILVVGAIVVHMVGVRLHPRPTRAGKAATFFQILTVLVVLLRRHVEPGLALLPEAAMGFAALFTAISGTQYIVQGMRFLNAATTDQEEDEAALRH